MLLKSWFVKWVPLLIFQKYISVHFLQSHNPLIPSYQNIQKHPRTQLQWNHSGYFSYNQRCPRKVKSIFLEHFYFSALLCCLLWLLSTIVDEVDEMLGVGPEVFEDLKTLMNQANSPLTMSMKPFLCMTYSTILLLQRNHDEVEPLWWFASVTSSLILALCMTLPSYEGYAGGGR